ncbi:hypothetical protein CK203_047738 [Vitis vinifera]|uniref:Uncharacterized protein n=1 Tax=Vitis vinifera TaxID=29760 RepID=A0A438H1P2_VITVI|nr:hypothetical protein CK203_047738 [Vitis vinifera]
MWDVPERDTNIEIDEEVCGGSDEEAYQDNESHELNWFVEQDDGFEFQRSDRLNIDPEVVNDNVLILENMNDNDDNFICDDIEEEDETLDDYANENEMWLSSDSESETNGGKPLPITIKPSDGKQTGKYCEKLSNEIGLTVRQHAPVRVEKWKQMPRAEINTMLDRIKFFPCLTMKEKFALDLTQEHVKKSFRKQLSNRFRNWKCDLHKHFKKFPTVVEAKRNPHESVSNKEDWDYLCDRFSSEEFK